MTTHAHTFHAFSATVALCFHFLVIPVSAQLPDLIPVPVEISAGSGVFTLDQNARIYSSGEPSLKQIVDRFTDQIHSATNLKIGSSNQNEANLHFVINKINEALLGDEGYRLSITPKKIELHANTPAGIFYGLQTLTQCLPKEITRKQATSDRTWTFPALSILDYPRFAWRGIMFDVSRHFFPKEYVKEYIDQLAKYKYNRLHLHLTDDNGWRLEIKSLPLLTSEGAWRVPRTGTFGSHEAPRAGEKATDGGFYTQEDMKEIIAFAKGRFIEIMPEIDVPGHSMAAIAAYPHLCVSKDTSITVNPGSDFSTWHGDGKFTMHIDNTLNPSDEKVYEFLDKVVTEVAALFPFEYIHMGGDECYKGYWERDPAVQAFMKKNAIKDGHELQGYFTTRVHKIVKAKNKKMIGWDEILDGKLSTDAAVMSWQGTKGGIEASKRKHMVVMSPAPEYYLDMGQGEASIEPPIYNTSRLKQTYLFNIVPPEADSTYIIGGQGNLWTEQIPTTAQVEYMTYPRAFAIAETLWSPRSKKNWDDFVRRTEKHFERLDEARINHAMSMYDPIISVSKAQNGQLVIDLKTEVSGLDLYYTLDNTIPNQYYSRYTGPIEVPADVDNFRVISYRGNNAMGKLITLKREDLVKRIKKSKA